ncbi:hypothetical protein PUS40_004644 [Vibrio alginolyticus]|nr:hypothetical protein [Vibrio alginolyticus]
MKNEQGKSSESEKELCRNCKASFDEEKKQQSKLDNIKSTFDAIRNLGICAVIIFAGAKSIQGNVAFSTIKESAPSWGYLLLGSVALILGTYLLVKNFQWYRGMVHSKYSLIVTIATYITSFVVFAAYSISHL